VVRRRAALSFGVAVLILMGAEVAARVAPALPSTARWADVEADSKARSIATRGDADIVYTGSSIVDAAIDPEAVAKEYGPAARSYNGGLEGADVRSLLGWVSRVLVPELHAKVVVIGLTPREINDNGSNQREFRRSFFGSRGWRVAAGSETLSDRVTGFVERHSTLVRERGRLREPLNALTYLRSGTSAAWTRQFDPETGRLTSHDDATEYTGPNLLARTTVYNDYRSTRSLEALRSGIRSLQDHGVTVVLLMPSVVEEDLASVVGRSRLETQNERLIEAADSTCAPVVDLRHELPDRTSFDDSIHVNRSGSTAESLALGRALAGLADSGRLTPGC
jgi:hypothetical protein